MKRSLIIPILLLLAMASAAWASPVTENRARDIAASFMSGHGMQATALRVAHKAPYCGAASAEGKSAYYVFDAGGINNGFVIVSGDDRLPAVLGYSDCGSFDRDHLPAALLALLDSYSEELLELENGREIATHLTGRNPIAPLVTAKWDQSAPYNTFLPYLPSGEHAFTGCVATAMAQVMYYWRCPMTETSPIPDYMAESLSISMPELSRTIFDWASMKDSYSRGDSASQSGVAVAELMRYCAQALRMDFEVGGSSASPFLIPGIMSTYFGYSAGAHGLLRSNYASHEWEELIYGELAALRPVIYSGFNDDSRPGHAFVCDGFAGDGLFHINWGWGGSGNGYYLLNVLSHSFIFSQNAILGIRPDDGSAGVFEINCSAMGVLDYTSTRRLDSNEFTITLSALFENYTSSEIECSLGWALYHEGVYRGTLKSFVTTLWPEPGSGYPFLGVFKFGASYGDGNYRLVPVFSKPGAHNWLPCLGSDNNYIEFTIDGDSCVVYTHGTGGRLDYRLNSVSTKGLKYCSNPIEITLNLTNNGFSNNVKANLFEDGYYVTSAFVGLSPGETGDINFIYKPTEPGEHKLTFSFYSDGSNPVGEHILTINEKPNLPLTFQVFNATDSRIINDNMFRVKLFIANDGQSVFQGNIMVELIDYNDTEKLAVQEKSQFITLEPNASTTLSFELENVVDGGKYGVIAYISGESDKIFLKRSNVYTIVFPDNPQTIAGDVNGDGVVNISDINALIEEILSGAYTAAGDVNNDKDVNISDINAIISIILGISR